MFNMCENYKADVAYMRAFEVRIMYSYSCLCFIQGFFLLNGDKIQVSWLITRGLDKIIKYFFI